MFDGVIKECLSYLLCDYVGPSEMVCIRQPGEQMVVFSVLVNKIWNSFKINWTQLGYKSTNFIRVCRRLTSGFARIAFMHGRPRN